MEKDIHQFGEYVQGARTMLMRLLDEGKVSLSGFRDRDANVYDKAIIDLILSSVDDTWSFLDGRKIGFRNWVTDKKGRLVKCEAYYI